MNPHSQILDVGESSLVSRPDHSGVHRRPRRLIPLVLVALALFDLRIELLLLFDHFTITSLAEAVRFHLLAVVVLLFSPSLWRRYGG